jgi:hypothetical protein
MAEPPSSPPTGETSAEDALAWYKSQYEQLEQELAEFRESSKELEAELEKDLDAADRRERSLREKAEGLEFEVDEWKVSFCYHRLACLPGLTPRSFAAQMSRGQNRGEHRAKRAGEGDYDAPRLK